MKEQDAAHSFEKEEDDIRGYHEPDDRPQSMKDLAEKLKLEKQIELDQLTRLRSELQQAKHDNECLKDLLLKEQIKHSDKDYTVIKNDELDRLTSKLNQLMSELQHERELRKDYKKVIEELIPLAVKSRISVDMPDWEKKQEDKEAVIERARKLIKL